MTIKLQLISLMALISLLSYLFGFYSQKAISDKFDCPASEGRTVAHSIYHANGEVTCVYVGHIKGLAQQKETVRR